MDGQSEWLIMDVVTRSKHEQTGMAFKILLLSRA